jgi:EAL domain-containing protein (putative c-di-GMP-specific phosphodiesterase class I)
VNNSTITATDVRGALERGELFVEYQPIVLLSNARCVGGEALIRWSRRDRVLQAAEFMPQVENTPLSGTLTYWVMDTVAAELGSWLHSHADARISINVPPEILGRGGLEYASIRSGLSARVDQIVLEVTERGVPDQLGLSALNAMADRGVRLALDDTMLDNVNLALLVRCRFNSIKLDRELIAQLREDLPTPPWLLGLGSLIKSSQLKVVAEGIETPYQCRMLEGAGVQLGQGHLFATSLRAREFMELWN